MTESPASDEDVDAGAFLEMLAAYLPGAEAIPEADIALWLRRVAKRSVQYSNAGTAMRP